MNPDTRAAMLLAARYAFRLVPWLVLVLLLVMGSVRCNKPKYACGNSMLECEASYLGERGQGRGYLKQLEECATATGWQIPPTPTRLPTP